MSINLLDLPRYRSIAEMDAACDRGESMFLYAPDGYIEPTPPDAPHQPGSVVYLTRLGLDDYLPSKLINQPLTVVSCTLAPVDDAELWDMELTYPNGEEVEFLVTNEDVVTTKPF